MNYNEYNIKLKDIIIPCVTSFLFTIVLHLTDTPINKNIDLAYLNKCPVADSLNKPYQEIDNIIQNNEAKMKATELRLNDFLKYKGKYYKLIDFATILSKKGTSHESVILQLVTDKEVKITVPKDSSLIHSLTEAEKESVKKLYRRK